MGINREVKPKKNLPKDSGEERGISLPPENLDVSSGAPQILPIEVADRLDWTEEGKWTLPKWLNEDNPSNQPTKTYQHHYLTLLRSRYWRLESDFRTFYNNYYNSGQVDFVVARRLIDTLLMSKRMLENDSCDLVAARDLLGVSEQFMVTLYPKHIAKQRAQVLASKLLTEDETLSKRLTETISDDQFKSGDLTALLSEITDNLNQKDRDNLIVNSLQVTKLENLVRYGKWAVLFLFISLPLIMSFDPALWKGSIFEIEKVKKQEIIELKRTVVSKPIEKIVKSDSGQDSIIMSVETKVTDSPETTISRAIQNTEGGTTDVAEMEKPSMEGQQYKKWFLLLAIAILGGVGAFFSGLMGLRKNRIQLADYQESMTNYLLRIIIGAMASMILFLFITWNAIPGVVFTNAGGILFAAFFVGFSESFFLKKLGVDEDSQGTANIQSSATAPASVVGVQEGDK
jgi:hypothetical protein